MEFILIISIPIENLHLEAGKCVDCTTNSACIKI